MLSLISNRTSTRYRTVFVLCVTGVGHALAFLALWHACCLIAYMIYVVYCAVQYKVYFLT
jgi:hypothetical protein